MSSEELRERALLRVGTTLRDKWHLDRLLDVGGMAAVYAATHRNGNRVAVKMLHRHLYEKPHVKERFLREGYLANKVVHRGAVRVLDDDLTEDGAVFLVMELLIGQTMETLLQRSGGTLGLPYVLAIADQTLDVLDCAHTNGLIHRDIKPANLFLLTDGTVKVLDFGLARFNEDIQNTSVTGAGMIVGTSSYMAPEQARADAARMDGRADLFSLGAVMFRSLSGRVVHEADSPTDRLIAAMSQPARSLAEVSPDLPPIVIQVVDKSLSYAIEARWSDAKDMQRAVRQAFVVAQSVPETVVTSAPRKPEPPQDSIPVHFVDASQSIECSRPSGDVLSELSTFLVEEVLTASEFTPVEERTGSSHRR